MQHLATIQVQVIAWKSHSQTSLCWVFFVKNDNLPMDLKKLQLLRCIICKIKQASAIDLCQCFTLQKDIIKYDKINGITPMRTHVEFSHPKLVAYRKLAITKELIVIIASHSQ
jgi:hypothetical protein